MPLNIKIIHCSRSANNPAIKANTEFLDRTIGRSLLSNPATHLPLSKTRASVRVDSVEEAVGYYTRWISLKLNEEQKSPFNCRPFQYQMRRIYERAKELTGQGNTLYLACWCKDELLPSKNDHACHCDVVREILNNKFQKEMRNVISKN